LTDNHIERGKFLLSVTQPLRGIGPDLFRAACNMGLEGLVSKRLDRPYRGGRSKDWIKVKNRAHPAMERVKESFL
jgi:ATP-dependent DNA ligase